MKKKKQSPELNTKQQEHFAGLEIQIDPITGEGEILGDEMQQIVTLCILAREILGYAMDIDSEDYQFIDEVFWIIQNLASAQDVIDN